MKERPVVGHPPLLRNLVKASSALLRGAMIQSGMMMANKPRTWTIRRIPSTIGSFLARYVLKITAHEINAMMSSVVCHLSKTYVSWFRATTPWMTNAVSWLIDAGPDCHAIKESQPIDSYYYSGFIMSRLIARQTLTGEVAEILLAAARGKLRYPMILTTRCWSPKSTIPYEQTRWTVLRKLLRT